MASPKYTFTVDEDFSLSELCEGIVRNIKEEDLYTTVEHPSDTSYIIMATNVTSRGSHVGRHITGTVRSISVYLEQQEHTLTMYFDHRAWADKATGFTLSWLCPGLFFSSSYGGIRQIYLEDKILEYVNEVVNYEKEVNLSTMNVKQRILLATPIISLIIFLTMGFVLDMWAWGCLAFLLIPIMPIVLGEISLDWIYPLVIVVLYAGLGFGFGYWHPGWILFLTIPVYYILFPRRIRASFSRKYNY